MRTGGPEAYVSGGYDTRSRGQADVLRETGRHTHHIVAVHSIQHGQRGFQGDDGREAVPCLDEYFTGHWHPGEGGSAKGGATIYGCSRKCPGADYAQVMPAHAEAVDARIRRVHLDVDQPGRLPQAALWKAMPPPQVDGSRDPAAASPAAGRCGDAQCVPLTALGIRVRLGVPYLYYIVWGSRLRDLCLSWRDLYVVLGVMENVAEAQLPGAPWLQISVKFFPSPSSPAAAAVRTDKINAGHDAFVCELGDIAQEQTGFVRTKFWCTVGPYYAWFGAAKLRQSMFGAYEDATMPTGAGNSSQQIGPGRKRGGGAATGTYIHGDEEIAGTAGRDTEYVKGWNYAFGWGTMLGAGRAVACAREGLPLCVTRLARPGGGCCTACTSTLGVGRRVWLVPA